MRVLKTCAVAFALATGWSAAARAADDPGVLVHLPDGRTVFVGADTIRSQYDVPGSTVYTLRAPDGSSSTYTHGGLSIRALLLGLPAGQAPNPDRVTFTETPRLDGTWSVLTRADLADPPGFSEGPALVWIDDRDMRYFRPVRDDHDANAADNLATQTGQALELFVHTGPLLTVTATAQPAQTEVGRAVHLTASVADSPPGESLTYTWSFKDGATATGASATHAYARTGTFQASVTVEGADDAGGAASVAVQVGAAPPSRGHAPGSGGSPDPGAPTHGPNQGSQNGGAGSGLAPEQAGAGSPAETERHGAAAPAPRRRSRSRPGHITRAPTTSRSDRGTPSPAAQKSTAAPAMSTSAARDESPGRRAIRAARRRRHASGAPPAGTPIEGRLIAAVTPAAAARAALGAAPSRAAAAHRPPDRPLSILLGVVAVLGLLSAGAAREGRGNRGVLRRRAEA